MGDRGTSAYRPNGCIAVSGSVWCDACVGQRGRYDGSAMAPEDAGETRPPARQRGRRGPRDRPPAPGRRGPAHKQPRVSPHTRHPHRPSFRRRREVRHRSLHPQEHRRRCRWFGTRALAPSPRRASPLSIHTLHSPPPLHRSHCPAALRHHTHAALSRGLAISHSHRQDSAVLRQPQRAVWRERRIHGAAQRRGHFATPHTLLWHRRVNDGCWFRRR
mmetsp:Transcript_13626/g.29432  ORF Transcript_13626/g.29432 Transcript_13626/m.29432 type:complete len:217 (+) Transcript_13626:159-809(+)